MFIKFISTKCINQLDMIIMKQIFSVLILLIITSTLFGQQKKDDEYLNLWEEFKKENAPFNQDEPVLFLFESQNKSKEIYLGDLKYKRESFTIGEEIIGVALHVTAAIHENLRYRDEIWKDPAKYFLYGYYHK